MAVLGLALKSLTNDVLCAVSLDVVNAPIEQGAIVRAYDPQASELAARLLPPSVGFVESPEAAATDTQALVLLTEWQEIRQADWKAMAVSM